MGEKRLGGPLSMAEKKYIQAQAEKMSYVQIAEELGRKAITVKKFIEDDLGRKIITTGGSRHEMGYDIRKSLIWKELEKEFDEHELKYFVWLWNRIVAQFKEDVFPTEELQIVDTIKVEILLDRTLRQMKESKTKISDMEHEVNVEQSKPESEQDGKKINQLEKLIAFNLAASQKLLEEYNDLLNKKGVMLKELKATRAERIKRIEDSRESFTGWVGELLRNTQLRKELGEMMEKVRIAIDVEKVRLMQPHKYLDGVIDYPLLSADTNKYLEGQVNEEGNDMGSDGSSGQLLSGPTSN